MDEQTRPGQPRMLLDIATVDGEARVLTDGLNKEAEEDEAADSYFRSGWLKKSKRESNFPLAVVGEALTISVADAQASRPIDKRRIPIPRVDIFRSKTCLA